MTNVIGIRQINIIDYSFLYHTGSPPARAAYSRMLQYNIRERDCQVFRISINPRLIVWYMLLHQQEYVVDERRSSILALYNVTTI